MSLMQGRTGDWEIVIGLEVHAQVTSASKLFSGASTEFGAEPNTQVSLVDAAMPGMLPVINEKAVEQAVRTGLGLNAQINLVSIYYLQFICLHPLHPYLGKKGLGWSIWSTGGGDTSDPRSSKWHFN